MDSREIVLWLDERWYQALSQQLEVEKLEDKLNEYLDDLISLLPTPVYDKIIGEIREEDLQRQRESEAAKKFSVFHVRERGQEEYFRLERPWDVLNAASMLRKYLRKDKQDSFSDLCGIRQRIASGEFHRLAGVRMEHPEKVTGAFALDFDKKEFSSVDAVDGWRTYRMQEVSTAAYHALRSDSMAWPNRMSRFAERLAGKEIASAGHLSARQAAFADAISEIDGRLNFYIDTGFDVDAVFGTHVCTGENDDCLNVYADYDMAAGRVCDELEVDLHRADGREESVPYTLNAVEKAMLLRRMEAYCLEQTGMTLKDYGAQLMAGDPGERQRQGADTVRPLSVFRVTQNGRTDHLLAEDDAAMDTLHAALRLRAYLIEKGDGSQRFAEALPATDHIVPEVFQGYADELRQGAGRVTTALNVDLDRATFSTLAGADGWQTYTISDVCLAAWNATIPHWSDWEARRCAFAEQLEDKLVEQEPPGVVPPSGPAM